jgi:single-stranded DNA-specific DHH superfamily exonuclease
MKNTTVVFYDVMDNDGKCSGAIVKQHLEDKDIEPIMIGLDRDLKSDSKDWYEFLGDDVTSVWFTDLRPRKIEDFEPLKDTEEVIIIDHHEHLDFSDYLNIDYIHSTEKISATMLAWDFLFSHKQIEFGDMIFERMITPKIVELVNDRDVWLNKLQPTTNYFFNVWKLMDIELFQTLVFEDEDETLLNGLLAAGKVLEEVKQRKIAKAEKEVARLNVNGWLVAVSNIEGGAGIVSELGNKIVRENSDVDFYANITRNNDDSFNYNLRSLNGVALDFIHDNNLSGGGHDNACGFKDKRGLAEILMSAKKRG